MKQVKVYTMAWDPNDSALCRNAILGPDYKLKPIEAASQLAEVGDFHLSVRIRCGEGARGCSPGDVTAHEYVTRDADTGDTTTASLSVIRQHEVVATGLALNPELRELLNLAL